MMMHVMFFFCLFVFAFVLYKMTRVLVIFVCFYYFYLFLQRNSQESVRLPVYDRVAPNEKLKMSKITLQIAVQVLFGLLTDSDL